MTAGARSKSDNSVVRDDLVNPYWATDRDLGTGPVRVLDSVEAQFWRKLIDKYLYPIDADKTHEAKLVRDLKTLRNNAVFLFFMLNFLWLFIIFLLQIVQEQLKVGLTDISFYSLEFNCRPKGTCMVVVVVYCNFAVMRPNYC